MVGSLRRGLPQLLLGCLLAAPAAASELDLAGSWYVLIHYKDGNAGNPDEERWDDRVWVFEHEGRRLSWVEYPIVVFEDETGRFERRSTGQYARILHYWEPDAGQRANIAAGLQVNSRGSKSKTLRGSDAKGWTSGRRGSAASASVVTYEEVWSIDGLPDRPVFRRVDFMGGGRTDTMEGLTEYTTSERQGDDVLTGTFVRDGTRRGTFRMMRAGDARGLDAEKSQREIQAQALRRSLATSSEARAQAADAIREQLLDRGLALPEEDVDELAGEVLALVEQGVPQEQIGPRLTERVKERLTKFAPRGARHDDAARYGWPFRSQVPRQVLWIGRGDKPNTAHGKVFRGFRRHEAFEFAYDFELPVGTPVVAARAGEVARVVDGFEEGGPQQGMTLKSNTVVVLHDDGSYAIYTHLKSGIPVKPKQRVERGDVLGQSGATGQLFEPELLFAVQRLDEDGEPRSVNVRFDDGSEGGVAPVLGAYYGGE